MGTTALHHTGTGTAAHHRPNDLNQFRTSLSCDEAPANETTRWSLVEVEQTAPELRLVVAPDRDVRHPPMVA
jgi:hypothetical protein